MSAAGIPQIAAVMGSCTAGGAYVPAMSDETVIVRGTGTIFLGGPPAREGRDRRGRRPAGARRRRRARAHERRRRPRGGRRRARAAHRAEIVAQPEPRRDQRAWDVVEPAGARRSTRRRCTARSRRVLSQTYDVREVIARIVDGSGFHEFKQLYGETLVCGFARIHGHPVAILANNGILFSRVGAEGRPLHRARVRARRAARLPAEHHGLHGRPRVRGRRHREGRREARDRRGVRRTCRSSRWSSAARSAPATTRCAAAPTDRASSGCGRTRASR